ncbi:MAG: TonB-dependent receptor plug domain-containing protein [Gammaproteobacteria bacterium]
MVRHLRYRLLSCAFGCTCALGAGAAEPTSVLDEIVVFGRRTPAPLSVSTNAGTRYGIRRVDIERANARSLDEVLELLPGINVRTGGDGTPRIDMRGLRTRQVKILINGVPLNAVGDGNFDPTVVPTEYIEAVEVLPGAGSQLYGDGALAGAINIVTRRGSGPPRGDLQLESGDLGAERLAGTFSTSFPDGDLFVSVGRRHRNAWRLSDDFAPADTEDGGKRFNSDLTRNTLYAVANWRPIENWEFGLTLNYYEGERGVPTSVFDDQGDIFASRPRYERASREDGWYVQASALFEPSSGWRNHAWTYVTNDVTVTERFADATLRPTRDPTVRNTYVDETRGRITGVQDILSYEGEHFGRLAVSFAARQEQLESDCVIQDLPIAAQQTVTTTTQNTTLTPSGTPASTYVLDYTLTSTNGFGATSAAGGNAPVARLTASDRPGGGIDFTLQNLTGSNFGPETYLKYVYLSPSPTFDLAGLTWAQAIGSQGDIGNINIRADDIDGWNYAIRVNFRRPEQGDALFDGETASWLFDQGTVAQFFELPALANAGLPDAYSAVTMRRTLANGFWGAAEIQASGGTPNDQFNVNFQALDAVDPNALVPVTTTNTTTRTVLVADPQVGDLLVDVRLCSGAGGGGVGLGLGNNRVERVPSLRFGQRLLTQERDIEVYSAAIEYAFDPWPTAAIVASFGYHALVRDGGATTARPGYSLAGYYDFAHGIRLRAAGSHKVRVPSVNQLYDPDQGNPALVFEQADSVEGGIEWRPGVATRLALTVFEQDVRNFIQTDLISERFENVAELDLRGVEVLGEQHDWFGVNLRAGYSYLWNRDRTPGTERKQQQYTPTHRMTLSADYTWRDTATLHLGAEYTADQFFYSRTTPLVRRELDDFLVVDVNVSVPLPGRRVQLYAGADNIFDADYAESYGIPQQGRFVFAGIKIHLP